MNRVEEVIREIGSVAGKFLVLISILMCWAIVIAAAALLWNIAPQVWDDLYSSAVPLIKWGAPMYVAWFFSISSSVSELLLGFLNKQLREAFSDQIPETFLPHVDEKHINVVRWFNNVMVFFDIITSGAYAWDITNKGQPFIARAFSTILTTTVYTFSEYGFIISAAAFVAFFLIAIKVTSILTPMLRTRTS